MSKMHSFNLCLMIATATSLVCGSPLLEYGAPPAGDSVSQYHTQDEHGQYAYGYMAPLYSKHETRTADGVTRGTFSYVDARGVTQTVDYVADTEGFRVSSSLSQQQANEETPEVAALRAQHLAAHAQAKLRLAGGDSYAGSVELPQPVQDTPEVAAAKVAFFKRFEAEKLRNQLLSEKQINRVIAPSIPVRSQPLYVYQPLTGYVYNYHQSKSKAQAKTQTPSRDYLPVV
ncbi:adult-specific rigid cuticular protein 15.7 [Drosophila miranda]|uniref:adult-specific rigid cuticular protein 15.7 n=1 Tax=Drosophila miranda TaxID=7229 RepID=UPI00143FA2A6|nr:adult-specific rigid cuticular protein 15.7 [Drosophila miranda]